MPRVIEETLTEEIPVTSELVDPNVSKYSTRLPPVEIKKEEQTVTRLPVVETPQLSIQDFEDNPEVQERAYRAVNYLYDSKYDNKTDAVDKYIDLARQADFNLTAAGIQYADLLKKQKRTDPETQQYLQDIGWLYNEFYAKNEEGKDKYKPTGAREKFALTGDILQGALTDLTNWATAITFPFTGGQSATARVIAGETSRQTLKQAIKNVVSKGYGKIPKVPIDPRSFKQVTALTTTEGFIIGSTDNYLRQKRFKEMGVEGYEDFSTTEMFISGGFGATIGFSIGSFTNVGYRFFDARALQKQKEKNSKEFEDVVLDKVDEPKPDAKIITERTINEPKPDAKIITLEEAAAESNKLRNQNDIPESTHVEQVLDLEATAFDTPNIKLASKKTLDEEPEIIIVDGKPKNKDNPNQKIIVGGKISKKSFDESVSTYLIFGKPTTYSKQLAKIDPNFETFLRYIRHDSTESIFDNPLKVVNDKLYQNRSYIETVRDIAGTQTAKLQTIKENLENSVYKYDRYKSKNNYKLKQGTALNNDIYKFLNTGRFDANVPNEVVKAGYEIRKIFNDIEKQAVDSGFVFHTIENFFPRYWKPGAITKSNLNKKRLAEQLMSDEGMNSSEAYKAVDSLLNKIYDDLDPSVGSLGQRTYKKLNTIPIQDLLTDDVFAVTYLYTNSMARKIARKEIFGFSEQEFNRKWLVPFFGGTLQRTSSQEGRDIILERLSAKGFDENFLNQSLVKEYVRLNFTLRQLGKDLPENIEDLVKLKPNKIESVSKKEKDTAQLRKDFKNLQINFNDLNKIGLTKNEQDILKNKKLYNVIDDIINQRIAANDFILKSQKVEGTLSEKNIDYRNTLKLRNASASAEKERVIKLHNYVVGIDGMPQSGLTQGLNTAVNGILTAQAMNKLGLATISSFPEMFIVFMKSGYKVGTQALLKTINDEVGRIAKNILFPKNKGRTLSRQELNEFNLVLKGSLAEAVQSSYSEGLGKYSAKGSYYFYRSILLDQYTKFLQIFSYNASKIMINDNLEKLSKLSTKQLSSNSKEVVDLKLPLVQLGIDIEKGIKWYKSGQRTDDLFYENLKASSARYVDEVVMNPSKESAQKPLFMTHWLGRLTFQLFSYPVSFANTIVRNSARDIKLSGGKAAPRIMATYAIMLGMTRLSRAIKTNGESLEEEYNAESILKDLDTLGVGGPLSLAYGYGESRKYGRNTFRAIAETVGGPTFGSALADFYVNKRGLTTLTEHMQPYRNVIIKAFPEVQFEFDQLIKDLEDSMANKTEFEKQLRRQEDYFKYLKKQSGIAKEERELKDLKKRQEKVEGGIVRQQYFKGEEVSEDYPVPYAKKNPSDRESDDLGGLTYEDQMNRLGFVNGGPTLVHPENKEYFKKFHNYVMSEGKELTQNNKTVTMRIIGVNHEGKEYLIPSYDPENKKVLSDEDAKQKYLQDIKSGKLKGYDNPTEAERDRKIFYPLIVGEQ